MSQSIFARNVPGMTEKLRPSCIGVAGCGGLGSNAAVALARAGVGRLIIADFDKVEESNLNRQYFFLSDVGRYKVDGLERHLTNINPSIQITKHKTKLDQENISTIFQEADILLEAFDKAESKKMLIDAWMKAFPKRPVISGNGLSNLGKTEDLKVTRAGNIWFCGDMTTEMSEGLCSARVAIVANMQANVAIELLVTGA